MLGPNDVNASWPPGTEDAPALARGGVHVRYEEDARGADDGVERRVGQVERLHVADPHLDRQAQRLERPASDLQHAVRDVDAEHRPGRPHPLGRCACGVARAGGDVEHPRAGLEVGHLDEALGGLPHEAQHLVGRGEDVEGVGDAARRVVGHHGGWMLDARAGTRDSCRDAPIGGATARRAGPMSDTRVPRHGWPPLQHRQRAEEARAQAGGGAAPRSPAGAPPRGGDAAGRVRHRGDRRRRRRRPGDDLARAGQPGLDPDAAVRAVRPLVPLHVGRVRRRTGERRRGDHALGRHRDDGPHGVHAEGRSPDVRPHPADPQRAGAGDAVRRRGRRQRRHDLRPARRRLVRGRLLPHGRRTQHRPDDAAVVPGRRPRVARRAGAREGRQRDARRRRSRDSCESPSAASG